MKTLPKRKRIKTRIIEASSNAARIGIRLIVQPLKHLEYDTQR